MGRETILVAHNDVELASAIAEALQDEGCEVATASARNLPATSGGFDRFGLVIIDALATGTLVPSFEDLRGLAQSVHPAKIGLLTTGPLGEAPAGVSFVLQVPFDVDDLLACTARTLAIPPSAEQAARVSQVHAYFAALTAKAWDEVAALCTDDVVYHLRNEHSVRGLAAFREYTRNTFTLFPDAAFNDVTVSILPLAIHAHYVGSFTQPDGSRKQLGGAVRFVFRGTRIAEIGVGTDVGMLRRLGHRLPSTSARSETSSVPQPQTV
ncbi:MAG: hypothetical protein NVS3B20_04660 [Polyangiales bacterium]